MLNFWGLGLLIAEEAGKMLMFLMSTMSTYVHVTSRMTREALLYDGYGNSNSQQTLGPEKCLSATLPAEITSVGIEFRRRRIRMGKGRRLFNTHRVRNVEQPQLWNHQQVASLVFPPNKWLSLNDAVFCCAGRVQQCPPQARKPDPVRRYAAGSGNLLEGFLTVLDDEA